MHSLLFHKFNQILKFKKKIIITFPKFSKKIINKLTFHIKTYLTKENYQPLHKIK